MADDPSKVQDQVQDARLHKTRNNTRSNAKAASMEVLEARLVDSLDLNLLTKQAHWNLKGPQFIGVHKMLDEFYTEQQEWTDMIAERIVQLGGTAKGTSQVIAERTKIEAYPTDIYTVADHVRALADRYATCANAVREAIDVTDEAGDADTADLFTEISRGLDKQLWFLEAHLQEPGDFPRTSG